MDPTGAIHRAAPSGANDHVVVKGRGGTAITAATTADGHVVLAYLSERKTTEGRVLVALASLDDGPPVLLSEEGAGATSVSIAPRESGLLAMYIDARSAMTPVHARTLTVGARLELGPDAVIFIGEGGTRASPAALGMGPGHDAFALITGSKDVTTFGLATITIGAKPVEEAPVSWELYPAALSNAPIAATVGPGPVVVARVIPSGAEKDSPRDLLIGRIDARGQVESACRAATSSWFSDVAITRADDKTLWLAYTSAAGTFVTNVTGQGI